MPKLFVNPDSSPKPARTNPDAWLTAVALLLILLIGGAARSMSLFSWDGGTGQHPDERFFSEVTTSIRTPMSWDAYFDSARSPANPRNVGKTFYVYGTFPVLLTHVVGAMLTPNEALPSSVPAPNPIPALPGAGSSSIPNPDRDLPKLTFLQPLFNPTGVDLTSYGFATKVGRTLVVIVDMGSILMVFFLGQRLFDRRVGLLAALLAALTVMSIQQSHFYVDPTFSTFFTLFALYWAVHIAQSGGAVSFLLLGIGIGFAMGNRITLAALGVVAIIATLESLRTKKQSVEQSIMLLVFAGVITLITFRMVQPYAFLGSLPDSPVVPGQHASSLDWMRGWGFFDIRPDPRFFDNMSSVERLVTGKDEFPPSLQWVRRTDYLFPLQNMVLWGMGPFLGMVVWAGWACVGWRLLRRLIARPQEQMPLPLPPGALMLWVWVFIYFLWQGAQFASSVRYMLPIYGALTVFGAALMIHLATIFPPHYRPPWRLRGLWLAIIVVVGTAAWAYAFTRIYTRPHSRVMAAQWVVEHVPPGARLTTEEWDDPLPLQATGSHMWGVHYHGVGTRPYAEDDPDKFFAPGSGLLDQLQQTDYIVLSSNRVYDSVARMPMRYPATLRYYHALFNGTLGFDLVADITSYPTLFGIPIPDQSAEEAFTVYDHPRVLIFQKTDAFSREHAEEIITGDVNWHEVYKLPVSIGDRTATALRITEGNWPLYREGSDSRVLPWFQRFEQPWANDLAAVIVWLLVLELLGLAMVVLLFHLLPWLPDRGISLARTLALLMVALLAWLAGSLHMLPFSPMTVWLCATPLLVAGAWMAWHSRTALITFWHTHRAAILTAQSVYLIAFALLLLIRWFNPDLWHPARGGEKPMDFAYLNAALNSAAFPPADPWFAGGTINYYYFGFVLIGTLIHLTTVLPEIGVTLAIPTLFGLTALGAWGIIYNLIASSTIRQHEHTRHAHYYAMLAPILLLLLGNLAQAIWYLNGYATNNQHRPEWAFWDATRIIEGTVNEFPFFTFLFADMHAHMMVMPWSLAMVGFMVALVRAPPHWHHPPHIARLIAILGIFGLLAGTLRTTNTWDYPTYLGLTIVTIAVVLRHHFRHDITRSILIFAGAIGLIFLVDRVVFLPFTLNFVTDSSGVDILPVGNETALTDWLRLYGLWLFIMVSTGVTVSIRLLRRRVHIHGSWWREHGNTSAAGLLLSFVGMSAFSLILWAMLSEMTILPPLTPLRALLTLLLIGTGWLFWQMNHFPPRFLLPLLWAMGAFALCLGVEVVVVRGDVGRMNTVFKFGLHAWTLFALSSAIAIPWMVRTTRPMLAASIPMSMLAWGWRSVVILLLIASFVYPLTATPARILDRFQPDLPRTLHGAAFLQHVTFATGSEVYPLAEDAAAIAWIRQNVRGNPIILEAHQPSYQWAGRIATYTGLPTLLGWEWHQIQQRSAVNAGSIIGMRQQIIKQIYMATSASQALRHIQDIGIEYIYMGGVERGLYGDTSIALLAELEEQGHLTTVFAVGDTRLYRVTEPGKPTILTTDLPITPPSLRTPPLQTLGQPVNQLPARADAAWNSVANQNPLVALVFWLLLMVLLAFVGLPLAILLFGEWPDGGIAWARMVGLLLVGYLVWLPTSFEWWYLSSWSLIGAIVVVMLLNIVIVQGLGAPDHTFRAGLAKLRTHLMIHRHTILLGEGIFFSALLAFVIIRAYNPDLWHPTWGGEKPMEVGFLNALLRSPVLPPYDPFMSDSHINYYYYGFFLMSLLVQSTGIATPIAYNLIIPMLFALTLLGSYSIVSYLTGNVRYGLIGGSFVAILGNLGAVIPAGWSGGIGPVLNALGSGPPATMGERLGEWYIGVSRIIPNTINEFPYWSFLFADMHPHMMALPMTLLIIALAIQLLTVRPFTQRMLLLGATIVTLGALAITNAWDFPTYALVIGGALAGYTARTRPRHTPPMWLFSATGRTLGTWFFCVIGALVLYMPFFEHYHAFVTGIGFVRQITAPTDYIIIYGLFLALLLPFLIGIVWRMLLSPHIYPTTLVPWFVGGVLLLILALDIRIWFATLIILGGALLVLGTRRSTRFHPTTWFILLLATIAWAVSLGIEVIYIRDHLAADEWYRMNTVFKFGVQIWTMSALAAAASVPHLFTKPSRIAFPGAAFVRPAHLVLVLTLATMTLVFPLAGTPARIANRFDTTIPPTLNGLAFMPSAQFYYDCRVFGGCQPGVEYLSIDMSGDADAIAWLNKTLRGTPIVLQADLWFYRTYAIRVASNTGFPTVVSPLHASEQHDPMLVANRSRDVLNIYTSPNVEQVLRLLAKYRVNYLYVGSIEYAFYGPSFETFEGLDGTYLKRVYDDQGVQIYQVQHIPTAYTAPEPAGSPPPLTPPPSATSPDLAELEQRVADDPTNAPMAFGLAEQYRAQNRIDEAIQILQVAIPANPQDIPMHHLFGDLLTRAGRYDEAEAAYRHAAETSPSAGNWNKLGVALLERGHIDRAEIVFSEAIRLEPQVAEPYYRLAHVYTAQQRHAEAITTLETYLQLAPDGEFSNSARQLLEENRHQQAESSAP